MVPPDLRAALAAAQQLVAALNALTVGVEQDADKVSQANGETYSHANEVLLQVENVGTDPAKVVRTVHSTDHDRPCTLDRPVHTKSANICNTNDGDETFDLTEPPPKLPRSPVFNPRLFALFWAAYPRKVGKKAAVAAFTRLGPTRVEVAHMVAALEEQRYTDQWRRGIIPHAATWLHGQRWTDEPWAGPQPAPPGPQAALRRAIGPRADVGTWRDRCPHTPECETPTQCELARQKDGIA